MAITLVTQTKEDVKIAPQLATQLRRDLKAYAAVCEQIKALEHAKDKHKGNIDGIREKVGVTSLKLDGYTVTQVANIRTSLSKEKLIEMGVSVEMLEMATVSKPGKPYLKVTLPGGRDDGE